MAARVTDAEVKQILDTDIDTTPFIIAAHRVVEDNELGSFDVASATLKSIEQFLAAHFACAMEQQTKSETTGKASATYQGEFGMRLDSTHYGQTAMTLDSSGILANLNTRQARALFVPA